MPRGRGVGEGGGDGRQEKGKQLAWAAEFLALPVDRTKKDVAAA